MRIQSAVLAAALLSTPAFAADPPKPELSAHDAAELSQFLVSAKVSYQGNEVMEILRLMQTLNAIAAYTPPAPAKAK